MRASEFITEASKIPDTQIGPTPGMRAHHSLDNSSPYAPWRFGAHFLAGADGKNPYEHQPDKTGPNGQSLVTLGYTDVEVAMVRQAEKAFGVDAKATELTPRKSSEPEGTHTTSPMLAFKGYEKKSKKKK